MIRRLPPASLFMTRLPSRWFYSLLGIFLLLTLAIVHLSLGRLVFQPITALERAILAALPPFVTTVGLFVDAERSELERILASVPLDLLQFHGDESVQQCEAFGRPYIKALRVKAGDDIAAQVARYPSAQGILLDAYVEGVPGGTGEAFDWSLIPQALSKPLILAGGLRPDNVAEAVSRVRPYAVDVSGGVEASKGVKDVEKVGAFIRAARGN